MARTAMYYVNVRTFRIYNNAGLKEEYDLRMVVTEEAEKALLIHGSWDWEANKSGAEMVMVSTRHIFQTQKVYARKLHLATREVTGVTYLAIEEGDRLIICGSKPDEFCRALAEILKS